MNSFHRLQICAAYSDTVMCYLQFRTYSVKAGWTGHPLPFILCDTMGLEEATGAGLDVDDIVSILKGHLPDSYQVELFVTFSGIMKIRQHTDLFTVRLSLFFHLYKTSSTPLLLCIRRPMAIVSLQNSRIRSTVWPLSLMSIMPAKLEGKLESIRKKVNLMG